MAAAMLRGASSLVSRPCAARVAFRPVIAPVRAPVTQRGALQVVAAEPDKDKVKVPKKRTDPAVKRAMIAEERRMYNKARKSACATRIKKVIKMADKLVATPKADTDIKGLEQLISEAFCEIDKAVVKGILHKNNGARKKARCSRYKKKVLLSAGLWTPPADHPDHRLYQKLQAKKPTAAAAS